MAYLDYDRSLLSLISSILTHYGVETPHKTLPELDVLLKNNYKNVVVMLFDGMGTAILEKHLPPDTFLRRNLQSTISSVFPPTTTAATTTAETGLAPIEHGWLGWSLYFNEIGNNVSIFKNTLSDTEGEIAADYHVASRYIPRKSVFDRIADVTKGKIRTYGVSPFSSHKCDSVPDLCRTVEKLCSEEGRKYIYTYWPQPDYDMHDYGTEHGQIKAEIVEINDAVEAMCKMLKDTIVLVTADHGLIDSEWKFLLDYTDITECIMRMPSIESRAMAFFIKDGMKEQFEAAFKTHFGDSYVLYTKEQVLKENLFGYGTPHPRTEGFLGDYLAVAVKNISIDCGSSENHDVFKAAHAGMTEDEINIPLIVFECQ